MNNNQINSRRPLYLGGALSAIIVLICLVSFPIVTKFFEYKITDIKFSFREFLDNEPDLNSSIVMVNLDDYSKIESGKPFWPYSYYAAVIDKVTSGNPTSLGIDIIFTNSVDTSGWSILLKTLEESFLAVNPYLVKFGDSKDPMDINLHGDIFSELSMDDLSRANPDLIKHVVDIPYKSQSAVMDNSSGIGFVNIEPDQDGILRRLPLVAEINGMLAPHFTLKLLCDHLQYELGKIELVDKRTLIFHDFPIGDENKNITIPLDGNGNMVINYLSFDKVQKLRKSGKFISVSAWDVMNARPFDYSNKTVIFGDNSSTVKEFSFTPMDGHLSNQLIFATAISNIMNDDFIQPSKSRISLLFLAMFIAFFIFISKKVNVLKFGIISGTSLICYVLFNFLVFAFFGVLIPVLIVIIPLFVSVTFMLIFLIYESQVKMGVLEGSLSSFLSPPLMEKIKNNPDMLKLGGERKRISVLFSDIVSFTNFTDKADPAEVQAVLEEYFAEMAKIIFKNNGIVDKYLGDGILAFFENPPDGVTSAQASVKAAKEMKEKAEALDKKYKEQKRFPFAICVGIATGYAKVGNIGPPEKVDYTIIGSVVNKASRLDGPGDPGDILMDEDTYHFIKDDYEVKDFGSHALKGFEKKIQIYLLR